MPGATARIGAAQWLFAPGVPDNAPRPRSGRLETIEALRGAPPSLELAADWRPVEWQLYIESLAADIGAEGVDALEQRFHLTGSRNYDILEKWLPRTIRVGYQPGLQRTEDVLGEIGRMKYLRPLYQALAERPDTVGLAREWFARFEARYHPIAREVVRNILAQTC